jgi:Fic family protein
MIYNWQQEDWTDFKYDLTKVESALFTLAEKIGRVDGLLKGLPQNIQTETLIDIMVSEAIKTSEIEGEYLSRKDVMSSIRNNLGFNQSPEQIKDKKAEGAAELMVDVRNSYMEELSEEGLFAWHAMLMKGSRGRLKIGEWRDHKEPMQVVSGPIGKEKVHYEAPPSAAVPDEMKRFIVPRQHL